ncbi:MAG: hypothetical protein JSR17_09435 [Proteobacteria bacterium]|nr:hypothetical protein [Pseudomonadota bacterium]
MSYNKLVVSDLVLQKTLKVFQGTPLEKANLNAYHLHGFGVFANPTYVSDPRIQFTTQLDITDIYQNYLSHYKLTERITFATFVKWIALKAMLHTPFTWRQINSYWFEFTNLPLLVTMRFKNNRELALYVLENVSQSTWEQFCSIQEDYKAGKLPNVIKEVLELPTHSIAYQILNVHLPKMTSYNVTTRAIYAHQPFIVFSDRYELDKKLYLPFYLNYSHATLTPEDAEEFINQFLRYAKLPPTQVEEAIKGRSSLSSPSNIAESKSGVEPEDDLSF